MISDNSSHPLPYRAIKVSEHVYWVGAIDWALRDFHGYATERGTTYNAYLILADKVTLIDTVKAPFKDEMMARIASVIDPSRIDYIISNHSEMDHSGSLPQVVAQVQPERVFASTNGMKALTDHFHPTFDITTVKDGETLSLGNLDVQFMETRMLHWPDSMFTYLVNERILFSNDAFGMHLASPSRFDDEVERDILYIEAAKYYANILMPYANLIQKLLVKVQQSGWVIDVIAPDHGPIWRKGVADIIGYYAMWAEQKPRNTAVVVYDTMWGSTGLMARAIAEGLVSAGTLTQVMAIGPAHRSDVATAMLEAGAFIVGSPTINGNIFPTVADVMTYLRGLRPRNKVGAVFGSYGWSGEGFAQLREYLAEMKIDLVGDGVKVKYVPDEQVLSECHALGVAVAEALQARLAGE